MSRTLRIDHHIPPKVLTYKPSTFATVIYCTICKTLALYSDMPPAVPCKMCGNMYRYRLCFSAKWIETIKPTQWWNPLSWWRKRTGYWDLSTTALNKITEDVNLEKTFWGGGWSKKF